MSELAPPADPESLTRHLTLVPNLEPEVESPAATAENEPHQLADIVKVDDRSRGHRPDGKFLSNHEMAQIEANQDQIRKGLPELVSDIVTVDDHNRGHRPDGKFLSQHEITQVANHQQQIREGLAEPSAPSSKQPEPAPLTPEQHGQKFAESFQAFDDELEALLNSNESLSAAQLVERVEELQASAEDYLKARGLHPDNPEYVERMALLESEIQKADSRLRKRNLQRAGEQVSQPTEAQPEPIVTTGETLEASETDEVGPQPRGLRQKLIRFGRQLKELYDNAGRRLSIAISNREYLTQEELSRRRKILGGAAGALVVAGAVTIGVHSGVAGHLAHSIASIGHSGVPHPSPNAAAHLASAHAAAANHVPTSISLAHGQNPWDVARQNLTTHGNATPTNSQILTEDQRILAINHLTAAQARSLPTGTVLKVA